MATSGTNTFELDVADIIEEAYERIGIEIRSGYDSKSARRSLNLLLQDLGNRQINLWKLEEFTVNMVQGTASYTLDQSIIGLDVVVLRRDDFDYRMSQLSRNTYQTRPQKTLESRPSQFYVERVRPVKLHVYPAPNNSTDQVILQAMVRIEDVTASTQTLDVPIRMQSAIISGLTYYLALKKKPEMVPMVKQIFDEELTRALMEDRERSSLHLLPKVC